MYILTIPRINPISFDSLFPQYVSRTPSLDKPPNDEAILSHTPRICIETLRQYTYQGNDVEHTSDE